MPHMTSLDEDVRQRLTVGRPRRSSPSHRKRADHRVPALAAVLTTGVTLVLALVIGASPLSARIGQPTAGAQHHHATNATRHGAARAAHRTATHPAASTPLPRPVAGTHLMVDLATAPSLRIVRRWQRASPYRAIGVYVPVAPSADDRHDKKQRNLTPSWVGKVRAGGWRVLPIYLGTQAPARCQHGGFHTMSNDPVTAQRQGIAAASDAARSTAALGLGSVPVMYDIEPYGAGCGAAVRAFFTGWTDRLHELGRLSGVYGVASSVGRDLLAAGRGYAQPDALWLATANGSASTAVRGLPSGRWSGHRANQFALDVARRYGGKRLHVDDSAVDDGVWTMTRPKVAHDVAAPALAVGDVARVVQGPKATLRWSAVDEVSSRVAIQTRVRRTAGGSAPAAWAAATPAGEHRLRLHLKQGEQECVRVRASDAAGNASGWVRRCTARLVDDRSLHGAGQARGWKHAHARGALHRTLLTARHRHARVSLGQAQQRGTLDVLLRGRGSVSVRVGGRRVAVLHAGGLRRAQVPAGTITLVANSAHVSVDGFVLTPR